MHTVRRELTVDDALTDTAAVLTVNTGGVAGQQPSNTDKDQSN